MAGAKISKAHQHQIQANKNRRAAYRANGTRERNQARRLAKHLKRFPWDGKAYETLRAISQITRERAGVKLPDRVEKSPVILRNELETNLTKIRAAKTKALKPRNQEKLHG